MLQSLLQGPYSFFTTVILVIIGLTVAFAIFQSAIWLIDKSVDFIATGYYARGGAILAALAGVFVFIGYVMP